MVNESIAHITCQCGEKFQVLNEEQNDWLCLESDALYQEHQNVCPSIEREVEVDAE